MATEDVIGSMAECGFWNRRLTEREWASLGAGFSPQFLRNGLVYYLPFLGSAQDWLGNTGTLTVTGAVVSSHPRMMYPAPPVAIRKITAAAGGGTCWRFMLLGAGC